MFEEVLAVMDEPGMSARAILDRLRVVHDADATDQEVEDALGLLWLNDLVDMRQGPFNAVAWTRTMKGEHRCLGPAGLA